MMTRPSSDIDEMSPCMIMGWFSGIKEAGADISRTACGLLDKPDLGPETTLKISFGNPLSLMVKV